MREICKTNFSQKHIEDLVILFKQRMSRYILLLFHLQTMRVSGFFLPFYLRTDARNS